MSDIILSKKKTHPFNLAIGTNQPDTKFNVIPTPNHNVEIISFASLSFELWDFAEISACLKHINNDTKVIIYMIDCVDSCKDTVLSKGKENMAWLMNNFGKVLQETIVITVANKQDDEMGTLDIQDIGNSWASDGNLMELLKGHDWRIFPCNSLTGDGIDTIFEYIKTKLQQRKVMKRSSVATMATIDQDQQVNTGTHDIITPWDNLPNPYHLNDEEFKLWFYQGKPFLYFDHWCLIRIIYLTMVHGKKKNIPLLHENLEYILAQSSNTAKSIQYSETQTLFWIQMVSFSLLKTPLLEGESNHFESFISRCQLQDDCWKDYYTFKLFYSTRASKEFLPPDKKSLPNAFKSSSFALRGSRLKIDYQVL